MEDQRLPVVPWWATDFGDRDIELVSAAIRLRCISQGRITRQFEEKLAERLGVPYVVCTSSGTTALTMALLAAAVKVDDEVIVPARTWIATAHAAMLIGLRVEVADVDECGLLPEMDLPSIPVNLNGRHTPWHEGRIFDCAQDFPHFPKRALAACYSMSTAKLLPTGQGGFVATRDEGFYRELRRLRTHDVEDAMVPQTLTWRRFGYNFRYTDIQASIGLAQLETLGERINRLQEIRRQYEAGLPSWATLLPTDGVPLYTEILHTEPEKLRAHLLSAGIEARPFYPSLHTAPYLQTSGDYPNAEKFSKGLFLPSGPAQTDENIKRTLESLHAYRN